MDIYVCVGSSCHLKGSYDIIKRLEQLIEEHKLKDKVTIKASFCLGHCMDGVSAKFGDEFLVGLSPINVDRLFEKHVLDVLT